MYLMHLDRHCSRHQWWQQWMDVNAGVIGAMWEIKRKEKTIVSGEFCPKLHWKKWFVQNIFHYVLLKSTDFWGELCETDCIIDWFCTRKITRSERVTVWDKWLQDVFGKVVHGRRDAAIVCVMCQSCPARKRQRSGWQQRDTLKGEVGAVFALTHLKVRNIRNDEWV